MSLTCRSASGGVKAFRYRRTGLRYQRNVRIRTAWRIRSARARRGWTRSRNSLASCSSRRNCARRRRRAASFPASRDGPWLPETASFVSSVRLRSGTRTPPRASSSPDDGTANRAYVPPFPPFSGLMPATSHGRLLPPGTARRAPGPSGSVSVDVMRIHVVDHPLVAHKLTTLRDKRTDSPRSGGSPTSWSPCSRTRPPAMCAPSRSTSRPR